MLQFFVALKFKDYQLKESYEKISRSEAIGCIALIIA